MINPSEKLHVQYTGQLVEKARDLLQAMNYVEMHLRGYLTVDQTNTWLQLKQHVGEGYNGLREFSNEVSK